MKKIMILLFTLLCLASGAAQACHGGYYHNNTCHRVFLYQIGTTNNWWIPTHFNPCGHYVVAGHWSSCVVGYRVGYPLVFIPGHYSKFVGWVPPETRYVP